MTYEEFKKNAHYPEGITKEMQPALKELVQKYPYFHIANWMYLKSLKEEESIYYEKELTQAMLHTKERKTLYYYIHNEERTTDPRTKLQKGDGSYFDMIEKIEQTKEDGDKTDSLKKIAERIKKSRTFLQQGEAEKETPNDTPIATYSPEQLKQKEAQAKAYIQEKSYLEAIKLLEELKNLNNSKKSIYFADQIRFLKKIIEN